MYSENIDLEFKSDNDFYVKSIEDTKVEENEVSANESITAGPVSSTFKNGQVGGETLSSLPVEILDIILGMTPLCKQRNFKISCKLFYSVYHNRYANFSKTDSNVVSIFFNLSNIFRNELILPFKDNKLDKTELYKFICRMTGEIYKHEINIKKRVKNIKQSPLIINTIKSEYPVFCVETFRDTNVAHQILGNDFNSTLTYDFTTVFENPNAEKALNLIDKIYIDKNGYPCISIFNCDYEFNNRFCDGVFWINTIAAVKALSYNFKKIKIVHLNIGNENRLIKEVELNNTDIASKSIKAKSSKTKNKKTKTLENNYILNILRSVIKEAAYSSCKDIEISLNELKITTFFIENNYVRFEKITFSDTTFFNNHGFVPSNRLKLMDSRVITETVKEDKNNNDAQWNRVNINYYTHNIHDIDKLILENLMILSEKLPVFESESYLSDIIFFNFAHAQNIVIKNLKFNSDFSSYKKKLNKDFLKNNPYFNDHDKVSMYFLRPFEITENCLKQTLNPERFPECFILDSNANSMAFNECCLTYFEINKSNDLKFLDLSNNFLEKLVIHNILPKLTELNLSKNNINETDFLNCLPNLSNLDLSDNRLSGDLKFHNYKSIKFLKLSGNNIYKMSIKIPGLEHLEIDRNKIQSITFQRAFNSEKGFKTLELVGIFKEKLTETNKSLNRYKFSKKSINITNSVSEGDFIFEFLCDQNLKVSIEKTGTLENTGTLNQFTYFFMTENSIPDDHVRISGGITHNPSVVTTQIRTQNNSSQNPSDRSCEDDPQVNTMKRKLDEVENPPAQPGSKKINS